MNIIFVSIPIGIVLIGLAIAFFFWAVRSGQYDDLDSPAYSILMDEDREERRRREGKPSETEDPSDRPDQQQLPSEDEDGR
ncbi:cbb3-type cytochrome oxidase assembly protein CcoS [Gammaproteobacteria bacterium AB-CW1]|uniref:Cbb3-type cytochrome oxidase assembly protein CcoS n=1 Tax=Natronospira elongata TaxID=3110268 RepID=A0AAP6JIS0_9GAMM|nr:cbb3-type cytochrome oxidase assembly protein CcoS [Gammaproteobacteria bacterium AB-CW1]